MSLFKLFRETIPAPILINNQLIRNRFSLFLKNARKSITSLYIVLFLLISLLDWAAIANAEGSRTLVKYGGHRPYLEFIDQETAGIKRQPSIKVFVKAGEQVNVGSSVPKSANGNADIVYRWPPGNPPLLADGQVGEGSFDVGPTCGLIDTVAKESAGPLPQAWWL